MLLPCLVDFGESHLAPRQPRMAAARRGSSFLRDALRVSSSQPHTVGSQAAKLLQRRGMAGGGDHHGPPKVNVWQDPLSPSKWKEEHFVLVSLTGWGLLIYGGFKMFSGGKKEVDKPREKPGVAGF